MRLTWTPSLHWLPPLCLSLCSFPKQYWLCVSCPNTTLDLYRSMFLVLLTLTPCTCFLTPSDSVTEYCLTKWKQHWIRTSPRWSTNRDTYFVSTMTSWRNWGRLWRRSFAFFNVSNIPRGVAFNWRRILYHHLTQRASTPVHSAVCLCQWCLFVPTRQIWRNSI